MLSKNPTLSSFSNLFTSQILFFFRRLKDIIEKVKIREKFINDIEIGKKKKLWLEFDEIQKDLDKMSEIMKKAQYDVTRDEKIFKDMQNLSKDIIATREKLSRNATNEVSSISGIKIAV